MNCIKNMKMIASLLLLFGVVSFPGCKRDTPAPAATIPSGVTAEQFASWPKTVEQAVTNILGTMSEADEDLLRSTRKEDLHQFHSGWGRSIRNHFGLWRGNSQLLANCRTGHPDEASAVIMEAVWEELKAK